MEELSLKSHEAWMFVDVGPGRQRTYDGLILLSETSYSTSQWDLENLGFSSTGL